MFKAAQRSKISLKEGSENSSSFGLSTGDTPVTGLSTKSEDREDCKRSASLLTIIGMTFFTLTAQALLRDNAIAWTTFLSGLTPEEYIYFTGPTGTVAALLLFCATTGFWTGWLGLLKKHVPITSKLLLLVFTTALLTCYFPVSSATILGVLVAAGFLAFGSLVGSTVPTMLQKNIFRCIGRSFAVLMLVVVARLTLPGALSELILPGLLCMALPAFLVRNTSCRDPIAGAQFGVVVQAPLIFGVGIYTAMSILIAVMHATLGDTTAGELLRMAGFNNPLIADSGPLFVKAAILSALTAGSVGLSAVGGTLGVLTNQKKYSRLLKSSAKLV